VALAHFGTDGVRGVANSELTAELALAIGKAAARVLVARSFLVGRDTRRSGSFLQAALSAGLASEGVDVIDLGVLPTPAVAYLAEQRGTAAAMVSASHNPYWDNGIKLFGASGTKLTVDVEEQIEREMDAGPTGPGPTGLGVGRISSDPHGIDSYREHLVGSIGGRRLDGLKVVLDSANGAASEVAAGVFASLGAEVTSTACEPDGANINDNCGSTHPERLVAAVVRVGADLGLAFDGDADRLVAVDHTGAIADGDAMLALFALDLAERGELPGNAVVVTVMTNLGFRLAMAEHGVAVRETPVGDRHVMEALDAEGLALGGEQSGHIVFRRLATTGDGVLTGLALADLVTRSGRPLAELSAGLIERVPQVLVNVAVADPGRLATAGQVWAEVEAVEAELGSTGRVLLRPSGTEPLVRIMVEAVSDDQAAECASRLSSVVLEALG